MTPLRSKFICELTIRGRAERRLSGSSLNVAVQAVRAFQEWVLGRERESRRHLFPIAAMSTIFRGKFLSGLTVLRERGDLPEPPGGWPKLWRALGEAKRWVVYCRPPFAGPESVLAYLSNYTHRVAISERRIERFNQETRTVTFHYRDYAEHGARKTQTVPVTTFARRFCQHLLPRFFTKIRHYGILANHVRSQRLPLARVAIAATRPRRKPAPQPVCAVLSFPTCPYCKHGELTCIAIIRPDGRMISLPHATRLPQRRVPP